ncbi:MAG: hypothetical protein AB7Q17_13210 [Phycisphaerae bacterium]
MSLNLVEMVVAIVLAALVFSVALAPTYQVLATGERVETLVRELDAHATVATLIERRLQRVWRAAAPPPDSGTLDVAREREVRVGAWRLRAQGDRLQQSIRGGGGFQTLLRPVASVQFAYQTEDGAWVERLNHAAARDRVHAVRIRWTDPAAQRSYQALAGLADRQFAGAAVELPAPPDASGYRREDCTRVVALEVGVWP